MCPKERTQSWRRQDGPLGWVSGPLVWLESPVAGRRSIFVLERAAHLVRLRCDAGEVAGRSVLESLVQYTRIVAREALRMCDTGAPVVARSRNVF